MSQLGCTPHVRDQGPLKSDSSARRYVAALASESMRVRVLEGERDDRDPSPGEIARGDGPAATTATWLVVRTEILVTAL